MISVKRTGNVLLSHTKLTVGKRTGRARSAATDMMITKEIHDRGIPVEGATNEVDRSSSEDRLSDADHPIGGDRLKDDDLSNAGRLRNTDAGTNEDHQNIVKNHT